MQLTILILVYVVIAAAIAAAIWLIVRYARKTRQNSVDIEQLKQQNKTP